VGISEVEEALPRVRLTVSKRGASVCAGPKGAKVSTNTRGSVAGLRVFSACSGVSGSSRTSVVSQDNAARACLTSYEITMPLLTGSRGKMLPARRQPCRSSWGAEGLASRSRQGSRRSRRPRLRGLHRVAWHHLASPRTDCERARQIPQGRCDARLRSTCGHLARSLFRALKRVSLDPNDAL
jgi:hypothetical protein